MGDALTLGAMATIAPSRPIQLECRAYKQAGAIPATMELGKIASNKLKRATRPS